MDTDQAQIDPTRERLLDEAEKLFAEKGFDGVSVREITAKADAHVSAINYHFGTKKNLYLSVFQERWIPRAERIKARLELLDNSTSTLEQVVHALAEGFLKGFASDQERLMHQQLMHREINQPTEALSMIAEQVTKPAFMQLEDIIRARMPSANENGSDMFLCIFSVFSQVLLFNFGKNLVSLLTGKKYDQAFHEHVVDHITRFSLHGLNGRPTESKP